MKRVKSSVVCRRIGRGDAGSASEAARLMLSRIGCLGTVHALEDVLVRSRGAVTKNKVVMAGHVEMMELGGDVIGALDPPY